MDEHTEKTKLLGEGNSYSVVNGDEEERKNMTDKNIDQHTEESTSIYAIKERIELGLLAKMFLGNIGQKIFYAILVVYLYGDLAIYAVIVSNSLTDFIGDMGKLTTEYSYYVWLTAFALCMTPFTFFNFQKTRYLQYTTLFTRNAALLIMIILSIVIIARDRNQNSGGNANNVHDVPWFDISGTPRMFGVGIYAFMCHHSLPSLITPVKNKKNLTLLLIGVFISIGIILSIILLI